MTREPIVSGRAIANAITARVEHLKGGERKQRHEVLQEYLSSSGFTGSLDEQIGCELSYPSGLNIEILVEYYESHGEIVIKFRSTRDPEWITEVVINILSQDMLSKVVNTICSLIDEATLIPTV